MDYELTPVEPSDPESRRFRVSSRTTRAAWIVDVRTIVAGRSVRVEFGREGRPPQGWVRYDVEQMPRGTSLRTVGEVRMSPLLGLLNTVLGRSLDRPDPELDARVARWLAENPDPRRSG